MTITVMEDKTRISGSCLICHKHWQLEVPTSSYQNWLDGMLIQQALYMLTPDQRELLISKICGTCFDQICEPNETVAKGVK